MIVDVSKNFLVVGLGLLGGSYAKGLKKYGFHIMGIDRDRESIDYALSNNIIDEGADFPDEELIKKADIVIFALYPKVFVKWIEENQHKLKENALITDVTGVKKSVVYDIQRILREDVEFIPAHPMAGKEVLGIKNSNDEMFKGANYIVTPTEKNTKRAIEECKEIGKLLGFRCVSELSVEEHDDMIGFVSQLTHVIAVSLMTCNDNQHIEKYTGDSFRDLTRIANINDELWSELFLMNREALLNQIQLFENQLDIIKGTLIYQDRERLREIMRKSTNRRKLFDK